ncbi:MAG: transposase [Nitrospira sp.]|jgi:putative transposase|uniref:integrase core domain-containing protein n=1 Tax=Nitrospira sp. ND1 TaxID=1658518 RepID=UPI0009BB7FC1
MDARAYCHGIQLDCIRPSKPVENGFIDECLNVEVLFTFEDAREKLARWQEDYNHLRPPSASWGRSSL